MRNFTRNLILSFALALLAVVPAFAQTGVDRTTFAADVTAGATTVTLTAASGAVAGGYLYVQGELMGIQTVSSTRLTVRRGLAAGNTPARSHSTGGTVWVGQAAEFKDFDVDGSCVSAQQTYLPHINTKLNHVYDCGGNGLWMLRPASLTGIASANSVCGGAFYCRDEFNGGQLVMQDDGTVKSVTDAEENFVYGSPLGAIEYREEQTKTTSSWVAINGSLDISADDTTASEGVEIIVGASSDAGLNQVVELGTNGACFSAMITVTAIAGIDEFHIGWRQNEAFADAVAYAGYSDWAVIGMTAAAGAVVVQDEEAGAGTQTDTGIVTWANGERRALKVCLARNATVTFYYSDASPDSDAPIYRQVATTNTGDALTVGDGMVPFIAFLAAGTTDAGITIQWMQLEYAK